MYHPKIISHQKIVYIKKPYHKPLTFITGNVSYSLQPPYYLIFKINKFYFSVTQPVGNAERKVSSIFTSNLVRHKKIFKKFTFRPVKNTTFVKVIYYFYF
ncbi:MAG: hypothetical protein KBG25_04845 [Paludibacteraceae bacterium]|nr:hypothetical protein [Paludibacteraceae bacterium]